MANQKQYSIVINGIKESISEVDILLNQIDKLEKRLNDIGKSGIKIDTKGLKDLENIKIPEINIDKINTKGLQQEMKQLEKDIAKGAKTIDGEYTNTLNGLRAQLRDMKADLGKIDLTVDADGFEELTDQIKELNDRVKDMEQNYGTFSRNVGNYTESMVDALNEFDGQMDETVGGINQIKVGLDALKGKQLFDVELGGQVVQFENVSQAIGEIDDMAHRAAAAMQELKNAGKENTAEYQKLQQEFTEFINKSAELERVRKTTDELRDSMASTTRGLDMGVQAFQAFGNAMQMASGIAGLFGQNQEEIEKSINRTVQIMGVLQAAQELYNQTVQKGTVLNKAYSVSMNLINGIASKLSTTFNIGAKASKVLAISMSAIPVFALVTAITALISYWDDIVDYFKETTTASDTLSNAWNNLKKVIMGVGTAVLDWLINPFRTFVEVMADVTKGNWTDAFKSLTKGVKQQFDVISDFQKGYERESKKQAENAVKRQKLQLDKQLLQDIEYNEAKYGNDWKYTQKGVELYRQYFANKLSMYAKDSEEYRKALNDQLRFERELTEQQSKGGSTSGVGGKSKVEIQRETDDNIMQAMKDGFNKEWTILQEQHRRELEDAEKNAKLREAIQIRHIKEMRDLINQYIEESKELSKELGNNLFNLDQETYNLKLDNNVITADFSIEENTRKIEQMFSLLQSYNFDSKGITKDWFKIDTSSVKNFFKSLKNTVSDGWDVMVQSIRDSRDGDKLVKALIKDPFNGLNMKEIKLKNFVFDYGGVDVNERANEMKKSADTLLQLQNQYAAQTAFIEKNMQETSLSELKDYYSNMLNLVKRNNEQSKIYSKEFDGSFINIVNERVLAERGIVNNQYEVSLKELDEWLQEQYELINKQATIQLELAKDNEDAQMAVKVKAQDAVLELQNSYEQKKYALTLDWTNKVARIEVNGQKQREDIIMTYNDKILEQYSIYFEQLISEYDKFNNVQHLDLGDSNLQMIAGFTQQGEAMAKYGESFLAMADKIEQRKAELNRQFGDGLIDSEVYTISINNLNMMQQQNLYMLNKMGVDWERYKKEITDKKNELNQQLKNDIIDQETYDTEMKKLEEHSKELGNVLTRIVKNFGDSWQEISTNAAQLASAMVGIWSQMFSQIADLQYQNEMYRIEQLQKQYDEEEEMLTEALEKQQELYEKHNENVNNLEGELETARGDRRLFLLDQINSEMLKREQAWALEQKIQKQQEQLERKKEALEKRQEQAEKKRNKANQKVQIAQATASTALAVTNALSVQPWFLGLALSAVAAAMGAVQIATIAKQKFADGGVIQGASHSQGGVKVLGGTAEVEGGEYITNKVTTSKNVDVLTFINNKKRRLDLSDFIEFYSSGTKRYSNGGQIKTIFADGGTLPNATTNAPQIDLRQIQSVVNQDNRPIYVSVTEIESVQNKVRNVRALAGLNES